MSIDGGGKVVENYSLLTWVKGPLTLGRELVVLEAFLCKIGVVEDDDDD